MQNPNLGAIAPTGIRNTYFFFNECALLKVRRIKLTVRQDFDKKAGRLKCTFIE